MGLVGLPAMVGQVQGLFERGQISVVEIFLGLPAMQAQGLFLQSSSYAACLILPRLPVEGLEILPQDGFPGINGFNGSFRPQRHIIPRLLFMNYATKTYAAWLQEAFFRVVDFIVLFSLSLARGQLIAFQTFFLIQLEQGAVEYAFAIGAAGIETHRPAQLDDPP